MVHAISNLISHDQTLRLWLRSHDTSIVNMMNVPLLAESLFRFECYIPSHRHKVSCLFQNIIKLYRL